MSRTIRTFHRRSTRLKGYNYAKAGRYYVTLNCIGKEFTFGEVIKEHMYLNEFGLIASNEWKRTPTIRENIELGEFIIMPNHVHGIIVITKDLLHLEQSFLSPSQTLGAVVRGYMASVTSQINIIRNTPGEKVWQTNYFDHIIRNKWDLLRVSRYIRNNPKNWLKDKDNDLG